MYPVMRVAYEWEKKNGRAPGPGDLAGLQALASSLVQAEAGGKAGVHNTPRADLLETWVCLAGASSELAPVASVVGGLVANNVIRAISGVNCPIKNMLFFSVFDNHGMVEDMPL